MGPDDMQIRLNGNTIYVTGEIEIKNGGGLKTLGSGCIIAEGNITYRTNGESDPNGFLFLMSVNGIVKIDNGDSIYGSIASFGSGANEIDLKNGSDITFDGRPSDGTLNFPGANENDLFAFGEKIVFWKVE